MGNFVQAFTDAFRLLDRRGGGHNFVSLRDLRPALQLCRRDFDELLNKLRREWKFTLSGAEGRNGVTPEEQRAAIHEDGQLLLFVSKRG